MTDLPPIDDELLSAYLDGEVTPAERAAVEADAAAMARLSMLAAVRDAVAAPVTPLADTDRERMIAAALAASETTPVVSDIGVARERRRWSLPSFAAVNWRPVAAVAAMVAVIALAVPVIRGIDLGGDASDTASLTAEEPAIEATADSAELAPAAPETFSAAGAEEAEEAADMDTSAAEMPAEAAADAPADESMAAAEPVDGADDSFVGFEPMEPELGEFSDLEALSIRVFADFDAWLSDPLGVTERNATPEELVEPVCVEQIELDPSLEGLRSDTAGAVVNGIEYEVWLFDDGTSVFVPADACTPSTTSNFFEG